MMRLDTIRRALAAAQAAAERLDDETDQEAPAADAAARRRLLALISEQIGEGPWVVLIDSTIIALTIEADGLAIIPAGHSVAWAADERGDGA
jgi:hypothetical protein